MAKGPLKKDMPILPVRKGLINFFIIAVGRLKGKEKEDDKEDVGSGCADSAKSLGGLLEEIKWDLMTLIDDSFPFHLFCARNSGLNLY